MKKLFLFSLALISFTTITHAQNIKIGIKGGINFSSLNGDNDEFIEGRTGFHAGIVGELSFNEVFAIQPEILYSSQGADINIPNFNLGDVLIEGEDLDFKIDYLNVPILLKYKFIKVLDIYAGPQFGIVVSEGDIADAGSFDLSGVIGAGVSFGKFFGQLRYNIGFTDVSPGEGDIKNGSFQLSVGYYIF